MERIGGLTQSHAVFLLRFLKGKEGILWEVDATNTDGGRQARSLIADSHVTVLRLWA